MTCCGTSWCLCVICSLLFLGSGGLSRVLPALAAAAALMWASPSLQVPCKGRGEERLVASGPDPDHHHLSRPWLQWLGSA